MAREDAAGTPRDLEELFAAALAQPPEERPEFLRAACGTDTALRADVESLLASHASAAPVFDAVAARAARDTSHVLAHREIGRVVGAYRVTEFVAAGGMGSVYRGARIDGAYHKDVAIKFVAPGLGSRAIVERFHAERQVLADLAHPHIARLLDGGATEDGTPYLVMEFVDGVALDQHCRAQRLDLRARLALFLELCHAVHYAHQRLVIHRDLKPSNVVVDGRGHLTLLDFGIAKVLPHGTLDAAHTATVERAGFTPRYASPEQLRGEPLTTATDIYSLAVLLYELVTDARPYDLDGCTPAEAERIVCEQAPLPPSRHRPGLPRDLECIVLLGLRKEPERRYASVEDLAADISRFLDGRAVLARPDSAGYRIAVFARRHRALVAGVALMVVVLAGALFASLRAYHEASRERAASQWLAYTSSLAAAESALLGGRGGEAAHLLASAPPALRGWEWRQLRARLDRSARAWTAHRHNITMLAFGPGGARLLSAGLDSTVRVWDPESGRAIQSWRALPAGVESLAPLADGSGALAGLSDGSVLRLRFASGAADTLHRGPGWAMVAASADGHWLGAGFFDGSIAQWDASTGALATRWNGTGGLAVVAFTPQGDRLIAGDASGVTRIWRAAPHRLERSLTGHRKRVYCLAVSRDGKWLVTGSMDHTAIVWEIATGRRVSVFHGHTATVAAVAFADDGASVFSTSGDGRLLRWDAQTGVLLAQLHGHRADVSAIAVSPGGATLATGDWGGEMRTWDAATDDVRTLVPRSDATRIPRILDVAGDARFDRLAVATDEPAVVQIDAAGHGRGARTGRFARVAMSPDGRTVFAAGKSGHIVALATDSLRERLDIAAHTAAVRTLRLDPRGRVLVSAADDSTLRMWRAADGALLRECPRQSAVVRGCAFAPDGATFATTAEDGVVRLWTMARGDSGRVIGRHARAATDVAFSADGRQLFTIGEDGAVRLWLLDAPDDAALVAQYDAALDCLAVSRDGGRLAVGGSDQLVHILSPAARREVLTLHGHVSRITTLAFAPRDRFLLSGSADGTLRVWDAPPP